MTIAPDVEVADPTTQDRNIHIWGTQTWKGEEQQTYNYANPYYAETDYWMDHLQSLTNSAIASGIAIESFSDYENFEFGRDLHKLFKDYTTFFGTHSLTPSKVDEAGFNIFAHTYGKGLFNIDLELDGSAITTDEGTYRNTSFSSVTPISHGDGSGVFSVCAVENGYASGTSIASSLGDVVVPLVGTFAEGNDFAAEFRNPHIVSGVEFVDISGSPSSNAFYLYDITEESDNKAKNQDFIRNVLLKMKSSGGLPRIRFDLSSYGTAPNKLLTDHKFSLGFKALVGDEDGPTLGGGTMGVWVHTAPKDGYFWSWAPKTPFEEYVPPYMGPGDVIGGIDPVDQELPNQKSGGHWVLTKETDVSIPKVLDELCFKHQFHLEAFSDIVISKEKQCIGVNDSVTTVGSANNAKVKYFSEEDYQQVQCKSDRDWETGA